MGIAKDDADYKFMEIKYKHYLQKVMVRFNSVVEERARRVDTEHINIAETPEASISLISDSIGAGETIHDRGSEYGITNGFKE